MGIILVLMSVMAGCDRGSHPRMIGSPAPDFTITDKDRTISLHALRGKPVVLNFWASWCGPCIEEMPSLIRMQKQMGSNVTVLAVDIRDSEADYYNFLHQYQVELLTVRDAQDKSSDLYGTTGQPETFIIDAKGTLRRKIVGPLDWTSPEILEYLKTL